MKLKIVLFSFACLFCSVDAKAQLCGQDFDSKAFVKFRGTKTYFVKSGDAVFDNAAIAALESVWKITPLGVIENDEFKTKCVDPSCSFISLILIGAMDRGYHYLALFNGGKKYFEYTDMLAYSVVNHWADEYDLTDCSWRVRNMIEGMVQAMDIVQKENIYGNTILIYRQLRDYYNVKAKDVKNRTLLVSETSMGARFKKEDLMAYYPYKIEICPRSKVEKAIADRSKDYYYLQPGITMNKFWFVIDPSDGTVVYLNSDMQGLNITKKNIMEMLKSF